MKPQQSPKGYHIVICSAAVKTAMQLEKGGTAPFLGDSLVIDHKLS